MKDTISFAIGEILNYKSSSIDILLKVQAKHSNNEYDLIVVDGKDTHTNGDIYTDMHPTENFRKMMQMNRNGANSWNVQN